MTNTPTPQRPPSTRPPAAEQHDPRDDQGHRRGSRQVTRPRSLSAIQLCRARFRACASLTPARTSRVASPLLQGTLVGDVADRVEYDAWLPTPSPCKLAANPRENALGVAH